MKSRKISKTIRRAHAKFRATFFVSTKGNDGWSGTLKSPNRQKTDGPFATLERARDAIRKLKRRKGLKKAVAVFVRGGKYFLNEPFVLNEKDGGTAASPVSYGAYPGERPIISGGRKITGWKPHRGKILKCEIPAAKGGAWKFRQLFLNGQRQVRARYPNFDPRNPLYGGWAHIEGPAEEGSAIAFKYKAGEFPRRWAKPTQGEVNIWPGLEWGDNCIVPIKSIDEKRRIITLAHRTKNFNISPWFYPTAFMPGNRFCVENLLEELNRPGEWCLDSEEGILYFWPPSENLEKSEVVAPHLDRLFDIRANHLTIRGFTFTETTYRGDNAHPTGVEGTGAMFPEVGWHYCGEAIHLEGAECCLIEKNRIYAVGGNGIYLQHYNGRNVIRRNEISFAGANGIAMAGGKVLKIQDKPGHPFANEVTDNDIHHAGHFNKYSAGVFLGRSEANVIGHNHIHHLPHHGINLGNDGYGRNIVEYNRIDHVCLETHDTGAINVWMEGTTDSERSGHVIRYNFIADNGRPGVMAWAIYLDNDSSNCFVYGNVCVRNSDVGILVHGGKNNVIENNIIVGSAQQFRLVTSWYYNHFVLSHRFCRNILYRTGEKGEYYELFLMRGTLRGLAQCDANIFFDATGRAKKIKVFWMTPVYDHIDDKVDEEWIPLSRWRELTGFDLHSLMADPLFVDPEHDDYRLRADSPAFMLGFQPINLNEIGPRKEIKN